MVNREDDELDKKIYHFLSRKSVWYTYGWLKGGRITRRGFDASSNDTGLDYEVIRWKKSDKPRSIWKTF